MRTDRPDEAPADPLTDVLVRAAAQAPDPAVRDWCRALLGRGERAEGGGQARHKSKSVEREG